MTEKIVEACVKIFKDNLVGVYLHGSMAMGCFNPDKSDIDVIIVIDEDINDSQKLAFMNRLVELNKLVPEKGIEMSVVKKKYCKPFVYPTPYELHFSNSHLEWFMKSPDDYIAQMKGEDKDLAAHFMIINTYGKCLYGANIAETFGQVSEEAYVDSIWCDVKNAVWDVKDNPMYTVLNLCRVIAYLEDKLILSKKHGGEWGLRRLSDEYSGIIKEALECYASDRRMKADDETQKFCEYCIGEIGSLMSRNSL